VTALVLKESGEMYLETIYVLRKDKGFVRAIDVGAELGYSKPSVSRAMGILRDGGYIKIAQDGGITLTEAGLEVAERTYERHTVLSEMFMKLGVDEEHAVNDACKIEHVISSTTFAALKKHLNEDLK
jgi:Mn-dependent DtxR family transcriptional regulator